MKCAESSEEIQLLILRGGGFCYWGYILPDVYYFWGWEGCWQWGLRPVQLGKCDSSTVVGIPRPGAFCWDKRYLLSEIDPVSLAAVCSVSRALS